MAIPLPPIPLDPELAAKALAYQRGEVEPASVRDAATVLVLRDGKRGPEVFMMERQSTMAFAAGMWVFPGGGVDVAKDGASDDAIVKAAVREVEEESGLRLDADDVVLWDAWTTPMFEPRRYRTYFFVAALPEGQVAAGTSTESKRTLWVSASDAIEIAERGEAAIMPPTYLNLLDVAQRDTVAAVLDAARARTVTMFTPEVVEVEGGHTLSMPAHVRELRMARIA